MQTLYINLPLLYLSEGQSSCFEYSTQRAEQLFPCSVHHLLSPEPLVLTYKYHYIHGMGHNFIESQITVVPQVCKSYLAYPLVYCLQHIMSLSCLVSVGCQISHTAMYLQPSCTNLIFQLYVLSTMQK